MHKIDACGLQCPGPILKLANVMQDIMPGKCVEISTTDQGFKADIGAWCQSTGNILQSLSDEKGVICAIVCKPDNVQQSNDIAKRDNLGKTLVVFSNDLDKAFASFIIANGAAATGKPVTMFFTFWGLSILRRAKPPKTSKGLLEKMFGWMLPEGSNKLKLSQMNMAGMGTAMMQYIMRKKNVESLPRLIEQAQASGVRMVACQMSMDVMGLSREELIDGIEIGGVASYIAVAEQSDVNLFI